MATVYRKTDKGRREIETRADRLLPRLRSVLIVIDGRRDERQLRPLVAGDLEAALGALLQGGYIEPSAVLDDRAARAAEPPGGARIEAAAPAPAAQSLDERRREAARFLNDRLGPAGEAIAVRVESSRSALDLGAALDRAELLLRQLEGAAAATAFRQKFIDRPLA